jgi:hypothetical protein
VERWIVRATCDQYELAGTVRDAQGRPVPFAVVEASYLDERLTTRSNTDGSFELAADEAVCDRRPPRNIQLVVIADDFRPKRTDVPFEGGLGRRYARRARLQALMSERRGHRLVGR